MQQCCDLLRSFTWAFLDAEQWLAYHKLISNRRESNSCFIKYQTLDKNISNFILYRLEFSAILKIFP